MAQSSSTLPPPISALIPSDSLSQTVLQHTQTTLSKPIFNHSLRVYLLAHHLNTLETQSETTFTHPTTQITPPTSDQATPLFIATMFHDMGTSPTHNGPQRFEVEGADAAIQFLLPHPQLSPTTLQKIWTAIALHTSAGIAERIDPFTRLLRLAVKADFTPQIRDDLGLTAVAAEIEKHLPRLDVEACLAEAVVAQAVRGELKQGLYEQQQQLGNNDRGKWTDSQKFPKASWPGVLLRGHLEMVRDVGEGWQGPNPAF